ncbi:MAG: TMEM175 family protein [Actinomycetota bacterium]
MLLRGRIRRSVTESGPDRHCRPRRTATSRGSSAEPGQPAPAEVRNPVEYHRDSQAVALFNDAVFAIAMTLLVVGIRVPPETTSATFAHALVGIGDALASYVISFLVVGIYWLGHHRQVRYMTHFEGGALVINLLFLMAVAFIPFPSAMLNRYFGTASIVLYASNMAVVGTLLGVLWIYAGRRGLLEGTDQRLRRYYTIRALYPSVIFLLSIPVAVVAPQAAVYVWALVFLARPVLHRIVYR